MTGKCSICLCAYKEPVSIPCGHVYCTKCLADHVNTPGSDDTTSSCPTCRTVFNIVTPDLTYLPKKYHQYVVPGVRRVYLDTSGEAALQKKLIKAESKIQKLEADQETLMKRCEQLVSASRAHAEGEIKERRRANKLERDFDAVSAQAVLDSSASDLHVKRVEDDHNQLQIKYRKLRQHYRDLEEQSKSHIMIDIIPPEMFQYETPANPSQSHDDSLHNAARYRRKILPLPRKRESPAASQPPIEAEPAKRPRLSAPGQLQAGSSGRSGPRHPRH